MKWKTKSVEVINFCLDSAGTAYYLNVKRNLASSINNLNNIILKLNFISSKNDLSKQLFQLKQVKVYFWWSSTVLKFKTILKYTKQKTGIGEWQFLLDQLSCHKQWRTSVIQRIRNIFYLELIKNKIEFKDLICKGAWQLYLIKIVKRIKLWFVRDIKRL